MNNTQKLCEQCGRKPARKRFCSNRCKDRYHNTHNPRGLIGLGMWLERIQRKEAREERENANPDMRRYDRELHPFSSDAIGQQ